MSYYFGVPYKDIRCRNLLSLAIIEEYSTFQFNLLPTPIMLRNSDTIYEPAALSITDLTTISFTPNPPLRAPN